MAGPEFPEYAFSYSKNAQELRDGLPELLRVALGEIEGELTDNPEKNLSRVIKLSEEMYIYRHQKTPLEITYRIDRERKVLLFLHLAVPALDVSKRLFISYSHKDEYWLNQLKRWLKPLEQRDVVTIWDDQMIKAGVEWRDEIQRQLASAKAAVLLVSMDFLESEFIKNNELPLLLNAARQKGLQILWIAVRSSNVDDTEIAHYQAVHKEPPLDQLEEKEQEKQLNRIYKQIKEAVAT